MATYHVLYNKMCGICGCDQRLEELKNYYEGDELTYTNVMEIEDYAPFFNGLQPQDSIILVGGDGSLNQFVNRTSELSFANPVYYYAAGTGNDFLRDIGGREDEAPVLVDSFIKRLPKVTVKGKSYYYINGVGYGIDGYCCEIGDALKEQSDKPVNYTSIAIKGLLFHYKPCDCTVKVDGKEYRFKKAWLAPTMNGRFYGGGMMAAPEQERLNEEGTQSVMLFYGKGKLKTLMAFPSIFKGEHIKKTRKVKVLTGKHIEVSFAEPRTVQIDGETILNVSSYVVDAG